MIIRSTCLFRGNTPDIIHVMASFICHLPSTLPSLSSIARSLPFVSVQQFEFRNLTFETRPTNQSISLLASTIFHIPFIRISSNLKNEPNRTNSARNATQRNTTRNGIHIGSLLS
eukprot:328655_1